MTAAGGSEIRQRLHCARFGSLSASSVLEGRFPTTDSMDAGIEINPHNGRLHLHRSNPIRGLFFCRWYGPGMHVAAGQTSKFMGAFYSCNGFTNGGEPLTPYFQTGIVIVGPVSGVRVSNVACK